MPWQVGIAVGAQVLLMPLAGWGVATLFGLPAELKLGVILVSCCPGGTASNVVCFLARGNLALSVLMTMVSTLLAVVLTPLLTKFYGAGTLEVNAGRMIVTMVTIVLLPVLGGVVLNQFFGERLRVVKAVSPVFSVVVIVLIVGAVVGATQENIVKYAGTLLPAVLIVHLLGFGLGYGWAKVFGLGLRERRTVSIEVGMQNSGLGSELAKTHFNLVVAAPCAISAFFHCVIGSVLASWWTREGNGS
ncbi:MAG: bile acid:sodium symporter family protein [Verrucomicrobiota bacterium]